MKKNLDLRVPYAQAVYGPAEKSRVSSVLNEKRTMLGKETAEFEKRVAQEFGKKFGVMVNSGSSANMIAIELLGLPEGSEVITPLLTFSTTVAPLIKNKLTPVFVDVEAGKYTVNIDRLKKMITPKTRALMIPLLLGNVPDLKRISSIAKKHKLYFIEDSCDTLGATYKNIPTGKYSDITTTSFYGSHIITAGGGGGMIMVDKNIWHKRALMLRGWGRSSALFSETENFDERFKTKLNGTPYDGKFIFSEIGYNFLPLEMSAAFGNAQLDKLSVFRSRRQKNFARLKKFFTNYEKYFQLPVQDTDATTQWLGFPLTIKDASPFKRIELVKHLEKNNIQTRPIFTGNILKQPGFKNIKHRSDKNTNVTEDIMRGGFIIACHHGLNSMQLNKLENVFSAFLSTY